MPISNERAKLVAESVEKHGKSTAANIFQISEESINRYLRVAKGSKYAHLPKVLVFDIETSNILARVWSIWQQNVGLNQIKEDWFVLSWAAKWLHEDKVMYQDLRGRINREDNPNPKGHLDRDLLDKIWHLLDEADVVVTQNGIKFDVKKLNARFIINGYQPPSGFKHIDTLKIAKRNFGFTSYKLEYMTDKLCTKYKKLTHKNFPGQELWNECLADNPEAWDEMELYNRHDVLSLEELYYILAPWDKKHPNFSLLAGCDVPTCRCGSTEFVRTGYAFTQVSKFQRYRCVSCGAETRGRTNLLDNDERKSLHMNIS